MKKLLILTLAVGLSSVSVFAEDVECGRFGLMSKISKDLLAGLNDVGERIQHCKQSGVADMSVGSFQWSPVAVIRRGEDDFHKISLDSDKIHHIWLDRTPVLYRADGSPDSISRRVLVWGDAADTQMSLGGANKYCHGYFPEAKLSFRLPSARDFATAQEHGLETVADSGKGEFWISDTAGMAGAPYGRLNTVTNFAYAFYEPSSHQRKTDTRFWVKTRRVRCVADFQE